MNHLPQDKRHKKPFVWKVKLALIFVVLCAIAFFAWKAYRVISGSEPLMAVSHNENIERTPEEIRSIKDIGQWEFLEITTEELVERHEPHALGDTHLVKVYKGTLRLGIDMSKAADKWFREDTTAIKSPEGRGTVILTLPDISLLDENFIDEAKTITFYEKGKFSAKAKQELYEQAAKTMKKRALTPHNLESARQAAETQFAKLFKSFGYDNVIITFEKVKPESKETE